MRIKISKVTNEQLLESLVNGTVLGIAMTDGTGVLVGNVVEIMKEDGSGNSWVVTIARMGPYGRAQNIKLYINTIQYRAKVIACAYARPAVGT